MNHASSIISTECLYSVPASIRETMRASEPRMNYLTPFRTHKERKERKKDAAKNLATAKGLLSSPLMRVFASGLASALR